MQERHANWRSRSLHVDNPEPHDPRYRSISMRPSWNARADRVVPQQAGPSSVESAISHQSPAFAIVVSHVGASSGQVVASFRRQPPVCTRTSRHPTAPHRLPPPPRSAGRTHPPCRCPPTSSGCPRRGGRRVGHHADEIRDAALDRSRQRGGATQDLTVVRIPVLELLEAALRRFGAAVVPRLRPGDTGIGVRVVRPPRSLRELVALEDALQVLRDASQDASVEISCAAGQA